MSTTDPLLLDAAIGKKRKVRGSWISFGGRIVAQVIGAVASITLALTFLQPSPASSTAVSAATVDSTRLVRPIPVRDRQHVKIAVLPLTNLSASATQDYLAEGITQALIADLAQIKALHVISRTSVLAYARASKPMTQVAEELGADIVIEGAVVRDGDQLRVSVQMIDGARDHHVWARNYDRVITDRLALDRELLPQIVADIREALVPLEQAKSRVFGAEHFSSGN